MDLYDSDLKLLARTCGRDLRVLKICMCKGFSTDGLLHIGKYCNDLRTLCLKRNRFNNKNGKWLHELALQNTGIESLDLRYFNIHDVKDLTLLAKICCRSLVSLKIVEVVDLINLVDVFRHAVRVILSWKFSILRVKYIDHPCGCPEIARFILKLRVDLNEPKDSSKSDKAAQNGHTPKSLTLEIHHGRWFTPTPSRSYIGGQVSSVNVVDIDEFCLHDLKDMVVKLGYGVEDLMYCHFLIPSLGLDYGLHSLNVDADVLEMSKYVKDYKIILVYVEHGSSIFVTPKKGVSIAVNNHLRKGPIEIDSSPDVNKTLTPMCHRNLTKEWEQVSSKSLSIGEVMKNLSKKQPSSSVEAPIVVECAEDPFEELDDPTRVAILRQKDWSQLESSKKSRLMQIMNRTEEVTQKRLKLDRRRVHADMNNFRFTADPKHDTSIGGVDVQDDDLDVIDYDSFGSDLDDGIDSERRMQLRELRRIGKQKNKGPNKYYFYLGQQFASKEIVKGRVKKHSVETRRQLILVKNDNERVRVRCQGTIPALVPYVAIDNNTDKNVFSQTNGGPVIRENSNSGKQNILGKDKTVEGKGKKVNTPKKEDKNSCPWTMLVTYTKECRWEVRTLIEDHTCIQSRAIKACTSRFLADHVIKSLATNPDIPVRAVQDQMQKQFEVGVSKMKAFRAKRIASDIMTDSPWPGQILTAVGVDANNGIYPVAYAIVEAESKASWCWFLNLRGEDLVKATSEGEFKKKIGELKSFNSDAYDWLMKILLEQWNRTHFLGRAKCDLLINNICEVFNRQLVDGRDQPIITCSVNISEEYLLKRFWKGCRGQGGVSSQAGAKKVSGRAIGATNVSDQAAGARKVSSQAAGSKKVFGQADGSRKVSSQVVDARKASIQPSAAQSTINQGPRQDMGLQIISQFCKKFRKFKIDKLVTQMGLITMAKGCLELECLHILLPDISNEILECMGTHLNNLHDFHMTLSYKYGETSGPLDDGILVMLISCSKLERLSICLRPRHGGLIDECLRYIGKYGHNLRYLYLGYVGESDAGLVELSKWCPKLRKLDMMVCPYSEQAITTFVFNIHSLRNVWIRNTGGQTTLALTSLNF
ncbi:mutator type transposase [Tanacetum coccineum]